MDWTMDWNMDSILVCFGGLPAAACCGLSCVVPNLDSFTGRAWTRSNVGARNNTGEPTI